MVLLASALPVNVGVVNFVMLSVLDDPVSLAVLRSGALGCAGGVVSGVAVVAVVETVGLFQLYRSALSTYA
jgi:hypothetical protein